MSRASRTPRPRPERLGANRALLWKEWREQRWRFALGLFVLVVLAFSLVRAQLIPLPEAVLIVFGPVGLLLAVFFAMGGIATEREDGTWAYLRAQPVAAAQLLQIKWLAGALFLASTFVAAGLAAHVAAASRNLFSLPPPLTAPGSSRTEIRDLFLPHATDTLDRPRPSGGAAPAVGWSALQTYETIVRPPYLFLAQTPAGLWLIVGLTLAAMLAWYTVLFFVLSRARDELHAGLGGLLLTLACLAWLAEYPAWRMGGWDNATLDLVLLGTATLNPLAPAGLLLGSYGQPGISALIGLTLWVAGPVFIVGRMRGAGRFA